MATDTEHNETELIIKAQNGERSAFGELVRIHSQGVFRVVYRMCGDRLIAEDATQETFIHAWQNLHSFRPQMPLRNWLYRIAFNASMDMLRKERHIVDNDIEDLSLADENPGPESAVSQKERTHVIQSAIRSLPEASRAVLILREYEEMSYHEIANALDIPVGTVMSRLNYARKLLKEKLGQKSFFTVGGALCLTM